VIENLLSDDRSLYRVTEDGVPGGFCIVAESKREARRMMAHYMRVMFGPHAGIKCANMKARKLVDCVGAILVDRRERRGQRGGALGDKADEEAELGMPVLR